MKKFKPGDRVLARTMGTHWETGEILTLGEGHLSEGYLVRIQGEVVYQEEVDLCDLCEFLISAQASGADSPSPASPLRDSSSQGSRKSSPTAATGSKNSTQESQTLGTCGRSPRESATAAANGSKSAAMGKGKSTSSQHRPPVSPSPSRGNDRQTETAGTCSRSYSRLSRKSDPDTLCSKTYPDCLAPAGSQGEDLGATPEACSRSLPAAGTMQNGFLSGREPLERPGCESGSCWLPSPGALSAGPGRRPGLTRLEGKLRQLELLGPQEVLDPAALETLCGLPPGYLDPSECRPATELIAASEKPQETFSIPESPASGSSESPTSKDCDRPGDWRVGDRLLCAAFGGSGEISQVGREEIWVTWDRGPTATYDHDLAAQYFRLAPPTPWQVGDLEGDRQVVGFDPHTGDPIWVAAPAHLRPKPMRPKPKSPTKPRRGKKRGPSKLPASGHLGPVVERRKGKDGAIALYPIVENRVPPELAWEYPHQYYWLYCYSVQDKDGCWRSRSARCPRDRIWTVRAAIARREGIAQILSLIKGEKR